MHVSGLLAGMFGQFLPGKTAGIAQQADGAFIAGMHFDVLAGRSNGLPGKRLKKKRAWVIPFGNGSFPDPIRDEGKPAIRVLSS